MLALVLVTMVMATQLVTSAPATQRRPAGHTVTAYPAGPDAEGQKHAPLGCAICLAVADRINSSLLAAHNQCRPKRKKRLTPEEVTAVLAKACSCGFQGYDLWSPGEELEEEEDEDEELCPAARKKPAHYVHQHTPVNWVERLSKACRWYVEEAGELELYHQWRGMLSFPPLRLDLFLCRNSGWLRACINLREEDLPALHPPVVRPPSSVIKAARDASKIATYSITRLRLVCTRFFCWRF